MLTRTRETQIQRATRTTRDIVEYAREVARDERLRADVSAALAHGSKASQQLKTNLQMGGTYSTLARDKKLRKNVRAMLDDLDAASSRLRRKKSRRGRALVLMLAGAVAAALAFPRIRPWLTERTEKIGPRNTELDAVT
jgi:hypothetical protein